MNTRIDQIASRIYRVSSHVPGGPPGGVTYNQFLVLADEPLLFHTGMPSMFPQVRDAVASVTDPASIRWISSGHASRPDEYGALAQWLDLAPRAQPAHGRIGCFLCLSELAARAPRPLNDGEVLELGGARVRWIDTPHVPGPWESGVMFEETSELLLCGDLFARAGTADVTTHAEITQAAIAHDKLMHGHALTPAIAATLRVLAKLRPKMLGLMHGPTFVGDGATELEKLAAYFEQELREATRVAAC